MSAVAITIIAGIVVPIIAGIVVPLSLYRRQQKLTRQAAADAKAKEEEAKKREADYVSVMGWDKMADQLRSDRSELRERCDTLQAQLDGIEERHREELRRSEERHRREIREMEADRDRREAAMQKQITDLQAEVDALRRALRRGGGTV